MKIKKTNVWNTTVKSNNCISCGICKSVCKKKAISLKANVYGELNPCVNNKLCSNCGKCIKFCPHTIEKLKSEALKISSFEIPHLFGVKGYTYYLAWSKDFDTRINSCSGGMVTELASQLLREKVVDGVIHVKKIWSKLGNANYSATVSWTPEEVNNGSSSAYQPINFSDVLEQLDCSKNYFVIGTPCTIRGLKKLFAEYPKYKNTKILTCALICSHNVNSKFAEYLGHCLNIDNKQEMQINFRYKDSSIKDADNYKTCFTGRKGIIYQENRFKSGWTRIWREYAFALNACNYCSDFWGYEADISVKDAWGEWSCDKKDPYGKTIAVVRNSMLCDLIRRSNLNCEELNYETMTNLQKVTAVYKQEEAKNKNFEHFFSKKNRKNGLFKNVVFSRLSKFCFKFLGTKCTKIMLEGAEQMFDFKNTFFGFVLYRIASSLRKLFIYRDSDRPMHMNRILVVGGYGYGNVGDEAQCDSTLSLLRRRYPKYQIINLTPRINYSFFAHPDYHHDLASRVLFFDALSSYSCYNLDTKSKYLRLVYKFCFTFKSLIIIINAFFVRANMPSFFISPGTVSYLFSLKSSSLLFFCGGGYLTGKTLSRLLEGILLCILARIFKVPVVMSAQTIGLWPNALVQRLAKYAFSYVKVITVRDETESLEDLKKICITGERCFSIHDDALFCDKSPLRFVDGDYVCINFHYWGMTEYEKQLYLSKMHEIIDSMMRKVSYKLVFIPMHGSDKNAFDDYQNIYQDYDFQLFDYKYDFRQARRVIADSKICITMKHHPIIFAMGETVPTISLTYSDYYTHKNVGALRQYGQEEFNIDISKEDFLEVFDRKFDTLQNKYKEIQDTISCKCMELKNRKEQFLKMVDRLLVD